MKVCTIEGCDKKLLARGMCSMHYSRDIYKPKPSDRGSIEERFWRKVARAAPDECWEWQGSRKPANYGSIWGGAKIGKVLLAHRVSYEIHNGPLPDGAVIMHTCDNPPCCNPAHLVLGTHKVNAEDKVEKARHSFGENRYNAKLTDQDVRDIRNSPLRIFELTKHYDVSQSVISNIRTGKTWRHVA